MRVTGRTWEGCASWKGDLPDRYGSPCSRRGSTRSEVFKVLESFWRVQGVPAPVGKAGEVGPSLSYDTDLACLGLKTQSLEHKPSGPPVLAPCSPTYRDG